MAVSHWWGRVSESFNQLPVIIPRCKDNQSDKRASILTQSHKTWPIPLFPHGCVAFRVQYSSEEFGASALGDMIGSCSQTWTMASEKLNKSQLIWSQIETKKKRRSLRRLSYPAAGPQGSRWKWMGSAAFFCSSDGRFSKSSQLYNNDPVEKSSVLFEATKILNKHTNQNLSLSKWSLLNCSSALGLPPHQRWHDSLPQQSLSCDLV